jgi:hypothetical protein
MAKKKQPRVQAFVVRASVANMELAKARSALRLELIERGLKLGELEVGRGSFFWTGRNRHRSKRIPWSRFAKMMDELAYGQR